jgi:hypothetical protein
MVLAEAGSLLMNAGAAARGAGHPRLGDVAGGTQRRDLAFDG